MSPRPTGGGEAEDGKKALASLLREQLGAGVDPRELHRRDPGLLDEIAADALPLLERLAPGEIQVRVRNPGGRRRGRTAIEVNVADQVFLVDTFRLSLNRLELRVLLLLHPLLPIERNDDGSIVRVGKPAVPRTRESYIYAEVPLVESRARRDAIEEELRRVIQSAQSVVADHMRMLGELHKHAELLEAAAARLGVRGDQGLMGFLRWLADENYIFVGYRHYEVRRRDREWEVEADRSSGLGVLRDERGSRFAGSVRGDAIPPLVRARLDDERLVYFDKARAEATIHRQGRLDSISIKMFDEAGQLAGFGRFVGMLTHQAIRTRPSEIPLLAQKRELLLAELGPEKGSHTYKAAIEAFDSLPVEFLFSRELREIGQAVLAILNASEHDQVEVCVVPTERDRSFFAAVVLPRELYNEHLRHEIHELLKERYAASHVDDRSSFFDENIALLHFFCSCTDPLDLDRLGELEGDIREQAEPWAGRLEKVLLASYPSDRGARLHNEYASAFPEDYRLATSPAQAALDIERIEQLRWSGSPVELRLSASDEGSERSHRLKIYQIERPYLTDLLPVLDRFGVRVVDAALTRIHNASCGSSWIVTFRIEELSGYGRSGEGLERRVLEGLRVALSGHIEQDSLNCLIQAAGLDWRSVDVLRAYLAYSRQIGSNVLRSVARNALLRYPGATRALLGLFRARFDPAIVGDRGAAQAEAVKRLELERDPIATAGDDQVFAILANLIESTVRTSFYAREQTDGRHLIAFKLAPERIEGMPSPRPWAEIYVHSARIEGVHLRGGPVARGGVRWSDREQDLRTEVLGLMKTQMVKNGLIVPVGAKGGFVLKQRIEGDPEQLRNEVKRQYVRFISALLALTDNLVGGRVVPPERVVRHDADDAYLVVAADRGTADLSDTANELAEARGFWLGDAFASGGSRGYDHKKEGITARGAWVCVRRHFLELGLDVERETYSVAGIGDMSGDVFGNGLLLARRGRLLAAFNHRHVFLDPDPDPERSWQERKRLFELPRSSWADYDASLLSAGGGVYERSAKRIDLSPEAQRVLDVELPSLSGEALVRAILRMPVDLLWNGGIGTYVKAGSEDHGGVGDRANDAVRIDAAELRARVVGEGGNLGFTQLARIECAVGGVRINADALDNSGGVDLSDHEVNFKIMLSPCRADGSLSREKRDDLLRMCVDQACDSVLAHNAAQSRCVSMDLLRDREDPQRLSLAMEFLVERAGLDPRVEFLPDAEALRKRQLASDRCGFTRPELSILLGYTKMFAKRELVASDLPVRPVLRGLLDAYFPRQLREEFADAIGRHPLRAEITATCLTNRVIDGAGITLVPEFVCALGSEPAQVVAAYYCADRIVAGERLRADLAGQGADELARLRAELELSESVRQLAIGLLGLERRGLLDADELPRWSVGIRTLSDRIEAWASDEALVGVVHRAGELEGRGFAPPLSAELARLASAVQAAGALPLALRSGADLLETAALHERAGLATRITWLLDRLGRCASGDGWTRVAVEALGIELREVQGRLTEQLLNGAGDPLAALRRAHEASLAQIEATAARIDASGDRSLPSLTVLSQQIRRLA